VNRASIQIGLEVCVQEPPPLLARGARCGLVMNQASVDASLRCACDVLAARFPGQLKALFSPQHGLWGEEQANMIPSPHGHYPPLDLPVYSLYGDSRDPSPAMLQGLDVLLIDLQDVGTRVYTFAWTLRRCLIACGRWGLPVVVLDRPNPLGGLIAEGPLLQPGYESFVGEATIPLRHGLTLGELALLLNREQALGAELSVVPMAGWRRGMNWSDTGRSWVPPSPNMPHPDTACLYPGMVLLEGTNLSEGRGTTTPFSVCGAPYIDPWRLHDDLAAVPHPGLVLRPCRFVPTFDKWAGQRCGGLALHAVAPAEVRSVALVLHLLAAVKHRFGQALAWLPPPYEYEYEKLPIDILFGSSRLRQVLECCPPAGDATIAELASLDEAAWWRRVQPFLLYPQ
jgi:uncharacterized protein YbbC (DUF1343 family)